MKSFLLLIAMAFLCQCGVKGDPIPPGTPVEMGRGRPEFRGAQNAHQLQGIPIETPPPEEKTEEEKNK